MLPDDQSDENVNDYALPTKKDKVVQPLYNVAPSSDNPAVNVIRDKINALYAHEPNAKDELAEAQATSRHRSKHQRFMYELSTSGKSLAEIQTTWHNYYTDLPDYEKHKVWQEFYANHGQGWPKHQAQKPVQTSQSTQQETVTKPVQKQARPGDSRSAADIKQQLFNKISNKTREKAKRHRSLIFGFSMGLITLFVMMFGFFNERIIAPFITPSRKVSSTPIITDTTTAVGPESKIIIPKINVEVPVVYDAPAVEEKAFQRALEGGVAHYLTTPQPGEQGNAVIFGHSSNNILNRGKYKFAFVLLSKLETGDTFMLHYGGKRYIYKVAEKKIVNPKDLSVLEKTTQTAAVTLITCDPPGTSINRLVVVGEQISPDPAGNVASSVANTDVAQPNILPSNAPSLWNRFMRWITSS